MSDRPYEKMLNEISRLIKNQKDIFKGTMKTSTSVSIGDFTLDTDDILIAEHLKTGWYKQNGESMQFIEPIKAGDTVLLVKITEEQYAIIERLVNL